MKSLGIDYGTKRIGLSLSDESGTLAFPHKVIENNTEVFKVIKGVCDGEGVGTIVVGKSLQLNRDENPLMGQIKPFSNRLTKVTGLPLVFEDETFTTRMARAQPGKKEHVDDSAAAIILQTYLDKAENKDRKS